MKKKKDPGSSYTQIEIDALRSMMDKKKKEQPKKSSSPQEKNEDKKDNTKTNPS